MKKIVAVLALVMMATGAMAQGHIDLQLSTPVESAEQGVVLRLFSTETVQLKQEDDTYNWALKQDPELINAEMQGVGYDALQQSVKNVSVSRAELDAEAQLVGFANWASVPMGNAPDVATLAIVKKYATILGQDSAWVSAVLSALGE